MAARNGALRFRTIIVITIAVAIVTFVAGNQLPGYAAEGRISPARMVLLHYGIPYLIVLASLLGIALVTILKDYDECNLPILFVLGLAAVGMAVLFKIWHSPRARDRVFLETFAHRVQRDVSVSKLLTFATDLEMNPRFTNQIDPHSAYTKIFLKRQDLPLEVAALYPTSNPYSTVHFGSNGTVRQARVMWGGPSYRWGIEIANGWKEWAGGIEKATSVALATNIVCFLADD